MKLGLIGAGHWGKRYLATVNEMPEIKISHVVSQNPKTKEIIAPGCKLSLCSEDLFGDQTLDGVILAVPPFLHVSLASMAISRGLPVLIEKPLALSLSDAEQVKDLSIKAKTLAMIDHIHLYSDAFLKMKHRMPSVGEIKSIVSQGGNWGPFREVTPMMWDYAPHDIAMCLDLTGMFPEHVTAQKVETLTTKDGKKGETVEITLAFSSSFNAKIMVSNIYAKKKRFFEVCCEDAVLVYDDMELCNKLVYYPSNNTTPTHEATSSKRPLNSVIEDFCKKITNKVSFDKSVDLGVQVVQVLARCQTILDAA